MGQAHYGSPYVNQDLRRLNDAALDLLWRVNPELTAPVPGWLPALLDSDAHQAAWELIAKLLLILNELSDIEAAQPAKSSSLGKSKIRKTGYPMRYVRDDLLDIQRGLTELCTRLNRLGWREVGPEIAGRPLSWLAEGVVARAEPILDAMRDQGDGARGSLEGFGGDTAGATLSRSDAGA